MAENLKAPRPAARVAAVLPRSPLATGVEGIERALAALQSSTMAPGEGAAVFKACTLNLLILAEDRKVARSAAKAAAEVSSRHPSRASVIFYRHAGPPGLEARVSGFCRLTESGQRQVCCEMVEIEARGHLVEHLSSVAAALPSADLPVFLWWTGRLPPADDLLMRLAPLSDTLLADSGASPDPARALSWLAARARASARPALADLAWERTADWRAHVIRLFDQPLRGLEPGDIDRVGVRFRGNGPTAEALLLGGWLTSRLGWRPLRATMRGGGLSASMATGHGEGRLELLPSRSGSTGANLSAVELAAASSKGRRLKLPAQERQSCLGRQARRRLVVRGADASLEETLCRALERGDGDAVFLASLEQAAAVLAGAWL